MKINTKQKNKLKNVSESMNSHTIFPFPAIPIPECLFLLSYMQKSVIILLVSSNDTVAFQSLQRPVHKWPSLFLVALVAPFQFLSRTLFFSASFSASSSQLSTASSVMFYKPATVDESFYVPSELVSSVSLSLGFSFEF